jgi:uncharacterized membrane protein YedE/YeeE
MEYITEFTPLSALIGGLFIGIATVLFLWLNGRVAGMSGLIHGLCPPSSAPFWRIAFILGLLTGGSAFYLIPAIQFPLRTQFPIPLLILAGILVGIGTRMANGCTSGHGICGIARFSKRSITATLLFMGSAVVTVYIVRHLFGVY